ncbi:AAA family ATPase [Cellulomonas xylanilytica]|uniref:Pilus biosynthesis protein CpaE n=1 Tax=Cellulomonas xylanilytica TaxID=233583 RepID=A0A510V8U8_9CELL|nr:P-loop NTPase [Cellulomonas xylanilytica]GEK21595.1 pilus biosynthesis protein CpaE [Cellulomonas xylanilytica]
MAVGVLCAVQGSAEAIIVQAVEQTGGRLSVTRRCADLTELLAAAEAGLGRLAVVSGDLDLLDREAIELLHRAGVRVVGIGDATRPWLGERLVALGADLVAVAPHDEASASDVVREALAILGAAPEEVAEPSWPDEHTVRRPARGLVVAVWGPTGAPGRTTVAVNVAAELAAGGRRTLLVDADTYGASVAQVVGMLDEAPGLAAAARAAGQGTLDLMMLARLTPTIAPGLRVLSGISRADRWPELPSSSLDAVWAVARGIAEWTVIDCGFCLEQDEALSYDTRAPRRNAATLSALEAADVVLVVGAGDPVGIQRLVRGLGELTDLGLGGTRFVLVNRVRASVAGPHAADAVGQALARYAGVTDAHLVPDDRPALDTALLEAQTLREAAPGSPVRRALAGVAARVDALLVAAPTEQPVEELAEEPARA